MAWHLRAMIIIALLGMAGSLGARADDYAQTRQSIVFGILPFMSEVSLIKRFSPLRDHLSARLKRDVVLETATDMSTFIQRTNEGVYDIVYTAPHFVLLATQSGLYTVLAQPSQKLAAHIMVPADSAVRTVAQLANRRVASGPALAFLTIVGKDLLTQSGLKEAAAPQYTIFPNNNSALQATASGDSDAAIVGTYMLEQAQKAGLRELIATPPYPSVAILASTRLTTQQHSVIGDALVELGTSTSGKALLERIEYPGFQRANLAEYDTLRRAAELVNKMLQSKTGDPALTRKSENVKTN